MDKFNDLKRNFYQTVRLSFTKKVETICLTVRRERESTSISQGSQTYPSSREWPTSNRLVEAERCWTLFNERWTAFVNRKPKQFYITFKWSDVRVSFCHLRLAALNLKAVHLKLATWLKGHFRAFRRAKHEMLAIVHQNCHLLCLKLVIHLKILFL